VRAKIEMAIAFTAVVAAVVLGSIVGYVLYMTP